MYIDDTWRSIVTSKWSTTKNVSLHHNRKTVVATKLDFVRDMHLARNWRVLEAQKYGMVLLNFQNIRDKQFWMPYLDVIPEVWSLNCQFQIREVLRNPARKIFRVHSGINYNRDRIKFRCRAKLNPIGDEWSCENSPTEPLCIGRFKTSDEIEPK